MEKGSAGYFKDTRMALTTRDMLGLPMLAGASFFMQALDSTILNTAIPAIASDLRQSPFSMQLAVVGYTLTVALLIPLSGWMADRFGTRRTYLASVADARRDNSPASGEITPPKTLLHICQQNYKMKGEGISPALSV